MRWRLRRIRRAGERGALRVEGQKEVDRTLLKDLRESQRK